MPFIFLPTRDDWILTTAAQSAIVYIHVTYTIHYDLMSNQNLTMAEQNLLCSDKLAEHIILVTISSSASTFGRY